MYEGGRLAGFKSCFYHLSVMWLTWESHWALLCFSSSTAKWVDVIVRISEAIIRWGKACGGIACT